MLILEGFQAGLSWITILKRREHFRAAFDKWDCKKVAAYTPRDVEKLMQNPAIIRNRLKIESTINNAKRFIAVQEEFGTFDTYIWQFTDNKTLRPAKSYHSLKDIPCKTEVSDKMSIDLKNRGFKFVGSVICYSFMQAVGMVDDHIADCFKFSRISA